MRSAFVLITVCGLASCSQHAPPPPPDVVVIADPTPPTSVVDVPEILPTPSAGSDPVAIAKTPAVPQPPPTTFPFPADAAGQALPNVVASPAPAPLPVERFAAVRTVRAASNRTVNPDPLPKVAYSPRPLLPAHPSGLRPIAPTERVPFDIGFGSTAVPARPALPNPPGETTRARDLNVPPPLNPVGRHLPDRASLDDPTADTGNAAIVSRSPTPDLPPAAFLKVTLPDPFELADQVKPKVAPTAEPGLAPVTVPPRRPK